MSMFQKATRKKAKLRLALCGTSGSGKTYSALLLAKGIGGKIAVIDTENGSASLYEGVAEFDVCEIAPPFSVAKYIAAIKDAEQAGYNTLVIDSLSHAWAGQGGLLEEVDKRAAASRSKNSYAAWRDITPMHNKLIDTILQSPMHIIVTMRTKTAYDMQKDERGKVMPIKVGMAPIQRDGLEYEFTVVLDLENTQHLATAGKDRTGMFDGGSFAPSEETGRQLSEWLEQGIERPAKAETERDVDEKKQTLIKLKHQAAESGLSAEDIKQIIKFKFGTENSNDLTTLQAADLLHNVNQYWNEFLDAQVANEAS